LIINVSVYCDFQFVTVLAIKLTAFWNVAPSSGMNGYQILNKSSVYKIKLNTFTLWIWIQNILKYWFGDVGWIDLAQDTRQTAVYCESHEEYSDFIKCGEYVCYERNCSAFKKNSASWS